MRRSLLISAVLALIITAPARAARIGLCGESYMSQVAAALDRVGLPYDQLDATLLSTSPPDSLDALFVAFDAPDSALVEWMHTFRARGGVLFTFFNLPPGLQELLGVERGEYVRQAYEGHFSEIRSSGALPRLPAAMRQSSYNIYASSPMADSVQVVARWFDAAGNGTGHAALLLGPGGAHLTHVLLGHDPEGAALMYTALLSHFFPGTWEQAVSGALIAADEVAGGRPHLGELTSGNERAAQSLAQSDMAAAEAQTALGDGRHVEALRSAFRSRSLAAQAFAQSLPSRRSEFRAVWIHNAFGVSDWGWERSCKVLAEAGFNAIIPNMLDAGITSYPSDILPVDERVAERGDQMAALVEAAHSHGIEVHAWKVNYNLQGADDAFVERLRQQDRLQANQAGEERPWLCPSHPDNLALEAESMLEVVRNYDVDGLHFDYIRYPGVEGCYDQGCRRRFEAATGHLVEAWPEDVLTGSLIEPFQKWRQDQITNLVRRVSIQARKMRPEIRISAAVFGDWPTSRFSVGQDWVHWIDEGYLDFVCPMDYIPDTAQFMDRVARQVNWVDGRVPLYIGIGAWQMPAVDDVLKEIVWTRESGADGFVLFEYSADLADRVLPLVHAGLTSEPARPPHLGPSVSFATDGCDRGQVLAGAGLCSEGDPLTLDVHLVPALGAPSARGTLSVQTVAGDLMEDLGELHTDPDRRHAHVSLSLPAGDHRPVVEGTYRDQRGKKHPFVRRGPVLRVRAAAFLDSLFRLYGPPEVPGTGIPVGIFDDAYGSGPLAAALGEDPSLTVFRLVHLAPSALEVTRILIIPQPLNRWAVDGATRSAIRAWVRDGGRLLVTHDMVGIRGAQPIIPEICRRGTGYPRSTRWRIVAEHPAVAGIPAGLHPHSYYDHVALEVGPDGWLLAEDDGGRPVLAAGQFGKGRYAALGLIPGLGPGDADVPLQGAERQLVEALVGWLAQD